MHATGSDLIPWAKRIGFCATAFAAAAAAQFGWAMGTGNYGKQIVLAGFCVIASLIVGYALIFAVRAFKEGRNGVGISASLLFAVAVIVEVVGAFGFNAAARYGSVVQAQHTATVYSDTRAELERARGDLAALKPSRPAAQIQASIDAWKARHAAEMERTAQCTRPAPRQSDICRRMGTMKTDLAAAQNREALDRRIQTLTAKAATNDVGMSDVGAQSRILASAATATVKPSSEAEHWTFVAVAAMFALLMAVSSLINFLAYTFDDPAPAAAQPTATVHHIPARDRIEVLTKSLGEMARAQGKAA